MKRTAIIFLSIALLLIGSLGTFTIQDMVQTAKAAPPQDVVIVICLSNDAVGNIHTDSFSSSANAPSVPLDADCAQSLADLLDVGFELVDVSSGNIDRSTYTFWRK